MSESIETRRATAADLDEVVELYGAVCDALAAGVNYSDWSRRTYPIRQTAVDWLAEDALYILREEGRIAATLALPTWQPEEYERAAWQTPAQNGEMLVMHTVATHPDFARRGYSARMVQFAIDEGRRQGRRVIRLDVCDYNAPAIKVYERAGFRHVDQFDLFGKPAPHHLYRMYEYPL